MFRAVKSSPSYLSQQELFLRKLKQAGFSWADRVARLRAFVLIPDPVAREAYASRLIPGWPDFLGSDGLPGPLPALSEAEQERVHRPRGSWPTARPGKAVSEAEDLSPSDRARIISRRFSHLQPLPGGSRRVQAGYWL